MAPGVLAVQVDPGVLVPVVEAVGHLRCCLGTMCAGFESVADDDTNIFLLSGFLQDLTSRGEATHVIGKLVVFLPQIQNLALPIFE